jgi:hypothetical protein
MSKIEQIVKFMLLSILLVVVAALLPQLPLGKPKKKNRQPKEENQKP